MTNYLVFSFKDLQGTHMAGPIVIGGSSELTGGANDMCSKSIANFAPSGQVGLGVSRPKGKMCSLESSGINLAQVKSQILNESKKLAEYSENIPLNGSTVNVENGKKYILQNMPSKICVNSSSPDNTNVLINYLGSGNVEFLTIGYGPSCSQADNTSSPAVWCMNRNFGVILNFPYVNSVTSAGWYQGFAAAHLVAPNANFVTSLGNWSGGKIVNSVLGTYSANSDEGHHWPCAPGGCGVLEPPTDPEEPAENRDIEIEVRWFEKDETTGVRTERRCNEGPQTSLVNLNKTQAESKTTCAGFRSTAQEGETFDAFQTNISDGYVQVKKTPEYPNASTNKIIFENERIKTNTVPSKSLEVKVNWRREGNNKPPTTLNCKEYETTILANIALFNNSDSKERDTDCSFFVEDANDLDNDLVVQKGISTVSIPKFPKFKQIDKKVEEYGDKTVITFTNEAPEEEDKKSLEIKIKWLIQSNPYTPALEQDCKLYSSSVDIYEDGDDKGNIGKLNSKEILSCGTIKTELKVEPNAEQNPIISTGFTQRSKTVYRGKNKDLIIFIKQKCASGSTPTSPNTPCEVQTSPPPINILGIVTPPPSDVPSIPIVPSNPNVPSKNPPPPSDTPQFPDGNPPELNYPNIDSTNSKCTLH